jgi:hypothetical protein
MTHFDLNEIGYPFSNESKATFHRTPSTEKIIVGDLLFDSQYPDAQDYIVINVTLETKVVRVAHKIVL